MVGGGEHPHEDLVAFWMYLYTGIATVFDIGSDVGWEATVSDGETVGRGMLVYWTGQAIEAPYAATFTMSSYVEPFDEYIGPGGFAVAELLDIGAGPSFNFDDVWAPAGQPPTVPEPTTILLLGSGLLGLAGFRRKLRKK